MHPDFLKAKELAFTPCGLVCTNYAKETESQEYGACVFEMNQRRIKFRVGKITPTKIGLFVTFWKRMGNGVIQPHELSDPFDFFVVSVRNKERFGQFVFPKKILLEKGIIAQGCKGGKRAMRIYPPWDITENHQAKNTQAWQLIYFFEINAIEPIDKGTVLNLFA